MKSRPIRGEAEAKQVFRSLNGLAREQLERKLLQNDLDKVPSGVVSLPSERENLRKKIGRERKRENFEQSEFQINLDLMSFGSNNLRNISTW